MLLQDCWWTRPVVISSLLSLLYAAPSSPRDKQGQEISLLRSRSQQPNGRRCAEYGRPCLAKCESESRFIGPTYLSSPIFGQFLGEAPGSSHLCLSGKNPDLGSQKCNNFGPKSAICQKAYHVITKMSQNVTFFEKNISSSQYAIYHG